MDTKQNLTLDEVIAESFDFSEYSDEEKKTIIDETSGMIMETSLLRSLNDGGTEVQEKFNDLIDGEPDDEAMSKFISENLPNFSDVVIEEIKLLKETAKNEE
ncbi:MAG: hypothetical protein LR005_02560 [Candidatus Pacebacteria bacterium]|nr:hypothetical protein [Candidatus Paceibacterota bacterium]